jgi:hypothetical protein
MKKINLFILFSLVFSFIPVVFLYSQLNINSERLLVLNTESAYRLITIDDITYTFKDSYDKTGKKYASEYFLQNNSGKFLRVRWSFSGGINANVQSIGSTVDIPAFTKVWIATVSPKDPSKSWDSGILQFEWEPVK